MSKKKTTANMLLDGNCFCFNFINTVSSRSEADEPYDYMNNYGDLMKLTERTEAIPEDRRTGLLSYAKAHPRQAEKALKKMKEVREKLYFFFSEIAEGETPNKELLNYYNRQLSTSLSKLQFTVGEEKLHLGWPDQPRLEEPVWRVMKSAYDVLTNESFDRIKECEACGWIFLDQSKNKSRRWCNMKTCGSAHKAKKYYHRKKKSK